MSVSLLEVIEHGGYDPLGNVEDAQWLLSKEVEFEGLIEQVEDFIEEVERLQYLAEEEQEKADELRQSIKEDGEI